MVGRTRTRTIPRDGGHTGAYTTDYPGPSSGECTQWNEVTLDVTGGGDCHHFTNDKRWVEGGIINKPYDGYWSSWFLNYVADVCRGPIADHLDTNAMPTQVAATRTAAATNPSSPYVDVAVSGAELREIPSLIRRAGNSALARTGGAILKTNFGIMPLARDLARLYNLTSEVDKYVQVIERLKRKRGLRRTIQLGTWSEEATQFRWVQTNNTFHGGNFVSSTSETVWGHARWTPTAELDQFRTPEAIRALATRAAIGLAVDPSTFWNLTPWSWLIDWCSSLGDYLASQRNIIPATLTELVVMRHRRTEESWPGASWLGPWDIPVNISAIKSYRDTKQRAPSFPTPFAAWLPFLNVRQASTLAALAANRLG